ncbi:DUF4351 domain-containing protein, partial [Pigmentiphaga soli]|uniref:DUF4351 domain-containing protein n=1 Tax=Pigmentiphaga soli TaxID=1007095 RepID=UPI0031EEF3DC
ERVIDWTRQWKQQGLEEGRQIGLQEGRQEGRQEGWQEGRQEGRLEGAQALLRKQLERRFGPLPEPLQARLVGADAAALEVWSIRLLDASSLQDVFGV